MKSRKLQSRTGKGVRIGDNESQIVARLGKPQKVERVGPRNQFLVLKYESSSKADRSESYTLRGGRLVEIEFRGNRDDDEE